MDNKQNILQSLWHQADSDDTGLVTGSTSWWENRAVQSLVPPFIAKGDGNGIYPFWSQHLYSRFPLVTDAGNDIQLTDFTVSLTRGLLDDLRLS